MTARATHPMPWDGCDNEISPGEEYTALVRQTAGTQVWTPYHKECAPQNGRG